MDAKAAQTLQLSAMLQPETMRSKPSGASSLRISREPHKKFLRVSVSVKLQPVRTSMIRRRVTPLEVTRSYENIAGMMGSGKTTVGKIMAKVLGYSFCDSDALVEEEVGNSVADIFNHYGEAFFRDKETEVLHKLSLMRRIVISTGGGVVIRPINWKHMHKGVSVWLDVPLEALAQRIAAIGTNSRPLLHYEAGDAYTRALLKLSALFEERGDSYANANARVSLEKIAAKLGHRDVSKLSPTAIAIEALEQIEVFLKEEDNSYAEH